MSEKNVTTVSLRFTGSPVVRRVIGEHEWTPENGHVADVPLELAADLLTGREGDEWQLAARPSAKVHKELAELMGLAPAELILIPGEEPEGDVKNG